MAFALLCGVVSQSCVNDAAVIQPEQTETTGEEGTRSNDFPWEGEQLLQLTGTYNGDSNSLTLSWSFVPNVPVPRLDRYVVMKKTTSGNHVEVAQLSTSTTTYSVTSPLASEKYYIQGRIPGIPGYTLPYYTVPSNIYTVPAVQPSPIALWGSVSRTGELVLTWSYKSGANTNWDRFQIWREEPSGAQTLIATQFVPIGGMSYTVQFPVKGNYYVRCGKMILVGNTGSYVEYSGPSNYYYYDTLIAGPFERG